uniref:Pentacotripeptide-repeat region of PRORP domain-containing protein n=1 Tax=Leersia perrieri TaxID=77586 RepID=A0A0D9XVX9_9ORYZ
MSSSSSTQLVHHQFIFLSSTTNPPPHPAFSSWHLVRCQCSHSAALSPTSTHASCKHREGEDDAALVALLRQGHTDAAYHLFASNPSRLPESPVSASRLLAQLSYSYNFSRAASLLQRLRQRGALHLLDANSLSLAASAAARSNNPHLSYSLLLSMLRRGGQFLPDRRAYTAALARLPPARALRLFHAVLHHLKRAPTNCPSSSMPDTAAFNAALSACADAGDCRRFRHLLDLMPAWNAPPDALTYNVLIKMCARAGRKDLVPLVLERGILSSGLLPCATTFHSLVAAYVGFRDIPAAETIVQAMRDRRLDICLLLRQLAAQTDDDQQHKQQQMPSSHLLDDILLSVSSSQEEDDTPVPLLPRAYPPNSRVYTTLMKGYMNAGRVDDVLTMLRAMRREGETSAASRPDHVTYTTVISTLAASGDMDRARAVLHEMARDGVRPSRVTYNVLIKGYCNQLQVAKARVLVAVDMADAGIKPDVVTYNTLIDGCVLTDDSAGAVALFNDMRAQGIAPSAASYTTLMKAFAASGQPKLAHKVFDEMEKDPRVAVDRAAWNMLVEAYCRLGLLDPAKAVVERMKARGVQPDVATYGSLAKGIAVARKPGEALLLWEEMRNKSAEVDGEVLEALADVCVRAALFRKALEMVAMMEEKGIEPNKGKYKRMYVELHSRMFTSKHASQARQDRRRERKRAAEAFKFWLGLPNSYYATDWIGLQQHTQQDDE